MGMPNSRLAATDPATSMAGALSPPIASTATLIAPDNDTKKSGVTEL